MIFKAHDEFTPELKNIITASLQKPAVKQYQQYPRNEFEKRLFTGRVKYKDNYFIGSLPREDYDLLKKKGARQTKKGLFFEYNELPFYYRHLIDKQKKNKDAVINNALASTLITSQVSGNLIEDLAAKCFKQLAKSFAKDNLTFTLTLSNIQATFESALTGRLEGCRAYIQEAINKIASYKKPLSALETQEKIDDIVFYSVKNTILNTTNEVLFELQSEQAQENDIKSFYWWHRPTLRPSDRMFHRKHYDDSKAGKKFYFNNLPTHDGQPDYPGKLWNCHCRAYIRREEFDRAVE